jgi:hypothetical protein
MLNQQDIRNILSETGIAVSFVPTCMVGHREPTVYVHIRRKGTTYAVSLDKLSTVETWMERELKQRAQERIAEKKGA